MSKIAFATHVALIDGKEYDGIGNSLLETLPAVTIDFMQIRHSMDGRLDSEVRYFHDGKLIKKNKLKVVRTPSIFRYLSEITSTISYFSKNKTDIFIGIDPLNAFAGVILKKRSKINKIIFYTPDYSPKRFNNKTLNWVYHKIDKYCVNNADEVWSVSPKIVKVRKEMGLDDSKNKMLPNVPPEKFDYLKNREKNKFSLITYGIIDKQMDFEGMIKAVAILKDEFPEISYTIVGNGPEEKRLMEVAKQNNVKNRVFFKGKKSLAETLELAASAGIGTALYNGEWGFNTYGDSTKCREYANFGLPIISSGKHATVSDIEKYRAGIIVDLKVESYVVAIKKVLASYDNYSKNSQKMGDKYAGMHKKTLLNMTKN